MNGRSHITKIIYGLNTIIKMAKEIQMLSRIQKVKMKKKKKKKKKVKKKKKKKNNTTLFKYQEHKFSHVKQFILILMPYPFNNLA